MTHTRGLIFLALSATLWSVGGVLIKSVNLHPLAIAGCRGAIAAGVLMLAARRLKFIWTFAQFGAAISFALTTLAFVAATKLTTAANAILLQYTAPVYVALLAGPLLGDRIRPRDWVALVAVMFGMGVFFIEKISATHFLGNLIALGSGFSFAGIVLFLRMQKGKSTFESLFLGHLITAAVGIPFLSVSATPTASDIGLLFVLGIFQLGIPYVLYGIAIRHVTALEASMIPVIEPILNPVWVAIFMGEVPSRLSLIGGAIVIGAVVLHTLAGLKRPLPPPVD